LGHFAEVVGIQWRECLALGQSPFWSAKSWNICSKFIDAPFQMCSDGTMTETVALPRDFQSLKVLIVARGPGLPKRLSQVAAYALEHPDEIAFGTAASIAEQAEVQPSTLVRFAQTLGYQGFSELQEVFRSRLRERVLNYEERLEHLRRHALVASKPAVLLHGFTDAALKSLAELKAKIEMSQLESLVETLARARTIYLIGLRRSFPISAYMAYAFGKLGVRHVLISSLAGLAMAELSFATAEDAVFAVSFTPYASESVTLATDAAQRGVPLASITDSPFSPLARHSNVWLEVNEADFEGFRSLAATLALAMTITVAVAEKRGSRG
jgi:DNA-binding MurR/RpiR family transcriptional regulator